MEIIIPSEVIENKIFLVRKRKVMLDTHLAELYGVSTKVLNQAVKRNRDRFPADFMFQLTKDEMLSSVLRSKRAVEVNIMIMRTFVKLREMMATHIELAEKIDALEEKYGRHDVHITTILKIIKKLIEPPAEDQPEPEKPPIGFHMPS